MKSLTYFDTITKQFAVTPCQLLKLECRGNDGAAAGTYMQIHDLACAPPADRVPLRSWIMGPGGELYKEFKNGELVLHNGLFVAVSTAEGGYTVGTGNNKFAIVTAELADPEYPSGCTVVGDDHSSIETLQGWATVDGPKNLYIVKARNNEGSVLYLQVHEVEAASLTEGMVPFHNIGKSVAISGGELTWSFGMAGVRLTACTIAFSTTQGTYTAPAPTTNNIMLICKS